MAFPVAIFCFFIGSTLIWVGSHGTSASSPWDLFQQVIAGLSGDGKTESTTTDDAGPNTDGGQ